MITFFQGIFGVGVGILILVFRPQIKSFIGDIGFAEYYLGSGGTWTFLALFGFFVIVFSIMWAFGTFEGVSPNMFIQ